jgi:hypothetical protein
LVLKVGATIFAGHHVPADPFDSEDFPVAIPNPEEAAEIVVQRLTDAGFVGPRVSAEPVPGFQPSPSIKRSITDESLHPRSPTAPHAGGSLVLQGFGHVSRSWFVADLLRRPTNKTTPRKGTNREEALIRQVSMGIRASGRVLRERSLR